MDVNINHQQLIVVDASVILAALFPQEAYKQHAIIFIDQSLKKAAKFIAPSLLLYEVYNAIRSAILSKRITEDDAQAILSVYKTFEPEYIDFSLLSQRALKIALESNCSMYDASYAAIAIERGCSLCTLDKKLIQKLKSSRVSTLYLGDYN